jgi:hypothetical protein
MPCNDQPEDEEEEEKASMKYFLRDLEGQRQMQKKRFPYSGEHRPQSQPLRSRRNKSMLATLRLP